MFLYRKAMSYSSAAASATAKSDRSQAVEQGALSGRERIPAAARALLAALLCIFAGCDATNDDDASKAQPGPSGAVLARVNVDNGSAQPWALQVDGKPRLTIAPYQVVALELAEGRHTFRVVHEGTDVDQIEATLSADTLTVINPGRRNSYQLASVTYVRKTRSRRGPRPRWKQLGNPKLLQIKAFYDLLSALPWEIETKTEAGPDGSWTRSKIYRVLSAKPAREEALAIVSGLPEAYTSTDRGRALAHLAKLPREPKIRDVLLALAEKTPRAGPAFLAIVQRYATDIEQSRIIGWLGGKKTAGAVRMLLARKEAAVVLDRLQRIPDKNLPQLLSAMGQAPIVQRRRLVLACLKRSWAGKDSSLMRLIGAKTFTLDLPFVKKVETYISGLELPSQRRWRGPWETKLCTHAGDLPRTWVVPRLVRLLLSGRARANVHVSGQLLDGLLSAGAADALAPQLGRLSPPQRAALYSRLSRLMTRNKKATPAESRLALRGLADPDPGQRFEMFKTLLQIAIDDPSARRRLEAALRREADERARAGMEQAYRYALHGVLRAGRPAKMLELAVGAASRKVVQMALAQLQRDRHNHPSHLRTLASGYEKISWPQNRVWLLQGLRGFGAHPGVGVLLDLGLGDTQGAVRSAAFSGKLALLSEEGPASAALHKRIATEPEAAQRKEMMGHYHVWLIQRLQARRRGATRQPVQQRLIRLAGDSDPTVSLAALGGLSNLRNGDVALLPALSRLFGTVPGSAHRQRILGSIRYITDPKVLALYEKALADEDVAVRYQAFLTLHRNTFRRRRLPRDRASALLEAAARREPDTRHKALMRRSLTSSKK